MAVSIEKLGKPAVAIITNRFVEIAKTRDRKSGMPNARLVFVPHPVSGKTPAQHEAMVAGKDPATGKLVTQEIVDAISKPLTDDDQKTGVVESKPVPRLIGPETPENLQRIFLASGWTDYLPVVLPTEQKVSDMLKGTSRAPDEVVGRMAGGPFEPWELTVEKVAANAVMAGAKPDYFPTILAIASSGVSSLYNSPDSLVRAVVINGPVREEIGMNAEIGAMGPFSQANATIGRAWTLISKNLANAGVTGEYTGSQGNSLNFNNIVIAENEARSPWPPLSVQKGFKAGESVVSIFSGLGIHAGQGAAGKAPAPPTFDRQFSSILDTFTGAFGALIVCDPLVAKALKAQGYDTKDKLSDWLYKSIQTPVSGASATSSQSPRFASAKDIDIVVTGGETLAVFQAGNLKYLTSIVIDKWR
jgi:hypothetical protein